MSSNKTEQVIDLDSAGINSVLESLNEGLIILDLDGYIRFVNSRITEITGYPRAELIGKKIYQIFFPPGSFEQEQGKAAMEARHQSRLEGVADIYETQITRKDQQKRWIETKAAPLLDQNGKIIGSIGAHFDITDRKLLEDQLRWSQKMEAVGRLAGGVAHDFNNLLTVIQGYSALLRQQLISADLDVKKVDVILEASEAASTLTQQLLSISLRQVAEMVPVSLNDIIEQSMRVVQGLVGERIEVKVQLLPFLPFVSGDPSQLQQIFLNLVVNARDAMPDGGRLTITTELVNSAGSAILQTDKQIENGQVRLRIEDSGHGMDEQTKARIFEPFFTTRKDGRGSGLGLAVTFGIVKEHEGEIRVNSEPGLGAAFDVLLPVGPAPVAENTAKKDWRPLTGSETILLVEDQIAVRVLLKETLELYGYTVIEAADGQEAIEIAVELGNAPVDLLVTDLIMPRKNGIEAAEEILKFRPELKVVVISGYPDEADVWEKIRSFGFAFLAKPFSPEALARFVRSVLDERERLLAVGSI